jgi:hypothetical protein
MTETSTTRADQAPHLRSSAIFDQFPDLRVQFPEHRLINRRFLASAPLEHLCRAIDQCRIPQIDHHRMHAYRFASSVTVDSPFTASSATRALNSGLCCPRFIIANLTLDEDQTSPPVLPMSPSSRPAGWARSEPLDQRTCCRIAQPLESDPRHANPAQQRRANNYNPFLDR